MKVFFKYIIGYIIVIITLMSCTPAPTRTPQPTSTPSPTKRPTSTPTLTATPTATSTPSPSQIAESLGLPLENAGSPYAHKYRIDGTDLMDNLSSPAVIAAQKNANGKWLVVTDPTVKYGALADSAEMPVNANTTLRIGDVAGAHAAMFNGVFTGEYEKNNDEYIGKVVYRDGDETVKELKVIMFSSVINRGIYIIKKDMASGGTRTKPASLNEALYTYKPAQTWNVVFIWDGPQIVWGLNHCDIYIPSCEYLARLAEIQHEQDVNLRHLVDSWRDSNKDSSSVLNGTLIPARYIDILVPETE